MKQKLLLLTGIFLCTLRAMAFNPDDTTKNKASEAELEAMFEHSRH